MFLAQTLKIFRYFPESPLLTIGMTIAHGLTQRQIILVDKISLPGLYF